VHRAKPNIVWKMSTGTRAGGFSLMSPRCVAKTGRHEFENIDFM
jgi:hypothetical protein